MAAVSRQTNLGHAGGYCDDAALMNSPSRRGVFWNLLATPGEEGTLRRRLVAAGITAPWKNRNDRRVNALSGKSWPEHTADFVTFRL